MAQTVTFPTRKDKTVKDVDWFLFRYEMEYRNCVLSKNWKTKYQLSIGVAHVSIHHDCFCVFQVVIDAKNIYTVYKFFVRVT